MELRYYQTDALDAIVKADERGVQRQLIVLPTGGGKTVVFSHIPTVRASSLPMLVLAHRQELLDQAARSFQACNPHLSVGIEQGERHAGEVDVIIASVPTLGRANSTRLTNYDREHFKVVVVDEAHHAAAETYRRILDYFSNALVIGVTATPRRGDNVGLNEIFEEIVYSRSMEEMISEGFLVDLVGWRFTSSVDLSDVRIVRGDFAEGELAKAVNTDARNEAIVDAYKQKGQGRKALVFCVNVAHAQAVADHFRDQGIEAWAVYGAMPDEDRRYLLAAHDRGDFPVLTNCQLATEGYDSPSIDMVIMARPTQSTVFYAQAVGRGTRLYEGKDDCIVVDIADISRTRRPVGLPSLLGLPSDFGGDGKKITEEAEAFRKLASASPTSVLHVRSLADIDAAWEKIDLFTPPPPNPELLEYSTLIWMELGEDTYTLNFDRDDNLTIRADTLGHWEVSNKEGLLAHVEDMSQAFRFADSWAKNNRADKMGFLNATAAWRNDPPSEKQIRVLRSKGIPHEHLTKGQASQLLDKIFADKPKRPPWLEAKIRAQQAAKKF